MIHYVDGEYCEDADAKVSVFDHGLLYGDGCYESIGIWEGRFIHFDEHIARFYRSARMLKIDFDLSEEQFRDVLIETSARNDMASLRGGILRPVLTRGSGEIGIGHEVGPPTLLVLSMERGQGAEPGSFRGGTTVFKAVISTVTRQPSTSLDPRIKSLNYLPAIMAQIEAKERGADLGILRNSQGFVAEGHAMNVGCVRDGRLLFPQESDGLAGVTREQVLETARSLGYRCDETNLTAYDFICADEAFMTSAAGGMQPIGSVEGRDLPGPYPGPVTAAVREAYAEAAWQAGTPVGVYAGT